MDKISILVVDDHPLFRQGVVDIFSLEPDFDVSGEADNGEQALDIIRKLKPSVAVVDINLPGINGQQVLRQVNAEKIPTKIILLTAYDDSEQMLHAMRGGAAAYCSKDVQPEKLVWVIRQVHKGKFVLGDHVIEPKGLELWLSEKTEMALRSYGDPGEPYYPLSDREMEVLMHLTRGMSNKEIAQLLNISHQTVKNHVTSILRKLGVADRTQAAIYALRHGWVRLYDELQQSEDKSV